MADKIQTQAEKIVDRFLDGYQYVVLDRNPESVQEPARTYETLTLAVDVEKGTIRLETDSRMSGDNAVEARQWHGIVRRFTLASSKDAARAYDRKELVSAMRDLLPLAKRVLDGGSVEWDGHNHVGVFTKDAKKAIEKLHDAVESSPLESLDTWGASDYLQEIGIDAWPDGMELEEAVQEIEKEAESNDVVLVGDVREVLMGFAYDRLRNGDDCDEIKLREVLKEKFDIDTDDPEKIAKTLYHQLNLSAEDIARTMANALHLSAKKIAVELCRLLKDKDEMHKDVAFALLSGLDLEERKAARVLASKDGPAWTKEELFLAFSANYYDDDQVADALHHGAGVPINDLARLMYRQGASRMNEFGVARALYSRGGPDLTADEVARTLHDTDGLGLDVSTVARVLHSEEGLDLSSEEVSQALRKIGLEWDRSEVDRADPVLRCEEEEPGEATLSRGNEQNPGQGI